MTPDARTASAPTIWRVACDLAELEAGWGETVLFGDRQIALLRAAPELVYAIDARDPHTGAMVMARGIMGSRGDAPTIASPLHKEVYDLRTGAGLSHPQYAVRTYRTRIVHGVLEVEVPG